MSKPIGMKKHTGSTRKTPEELIPGYKHIYGTDRDRFRALSTDSYRFYIVESVWIPRGECRIHKLYALLKRSEAKEDYSFCSEIMAAIKNLCAIYLNEGLIKHEFLLKF
jgi:hypothetical protein